LNASISRSWACNVAARLCAEAKDGQILLSQRVNVALKGSIATDQLGALTLKGLTQPVVAYTSRSQPPNRLSVLSTAAHNLFDRDHMPLVVPSMTAMVDGPDECSHVPVPVYGEGPLSIVEPPLPTGAIGAPPVRRRDGAPTAA
jgi:hypothetical protein